MACPKCTGKKATATALTRANAERIMRTLAAELHKARPELTELQAEEIAKESILLKRPSLLVVCDSCAHEWFE